MLGDHEFSDGAVHYTDAYSAYGPIVAGKSGIWWFTLRNRWDPGARDMPADREVLNAARDRRQHWELTTAAMPSALLGELCEATAVSCRSILDAEDGLAGWRYRIPPWTAMAGPAPSAGGGQFWLVLAGDAAVDGRRSVARQFLHFRRPGGSRLAGASGPSAPNCCACNSAARRIASARAKTLNRVVIARDRRRNLPLFPFLAPRMLCQVGNNSLTARPRACAKKSNRNRPTAKAERIMRSSQRPRARF
jgi:hypothetical protein